ncbi:hypothetical protein QUF63_09850 [Anaerolineales bacterium HSG25]|nr:hypothetical protein [Anaerolineales bacterium HSG25]
MSQDIYTAPETIAKARATSLQAALPMPSQGRVTMAAGVVEASDEIRHVAVGTSEPRAYLRPGVRAVLQPDDIVVSGIGHAEKKIVEWAKSKAVPTFKISQTD